MVGFRKEEVPIGPAYRQAGGRRLGFGGSRVRLRNACLSADRASAGLKIS